MNNIQGTIRLYPDAFLAPSVIVCEGASEVGLVRGLDQYRVGKRKTSIAALGIALVDGAGTDKLFKRADAFDALGYRTAVLRDDDTQPTPELEMAFQNKGGKVIAWRSGRALEDEIFNSLSDAAVQKLIKHTVKIHERELVNQHIKSASNNQCDLAECQAGPLTLEMRVILGKAAKSKKASWFKSISIMEDIACNIIGPDLSQMDVGFRELLQEIFKWAIDA